MRLLAARVGRCQPLQADAELDLIVKVVPQRRRLVPVGGDNHGAFITIADRYAGQALQLVAESGPAPLAFQAKRRQRFLAWFGLYACRKHAARSPRCTTGSGTDGMGIVDRDPATSLCQTPGNAQAINAATDHDDMGRFTRHAPFRLPALALSRSGSTRVCSQPGAWKAH